jgi:CheY-like chemotaxis protein
MAPLRRGLVVDDDEGVRLMLARALMMDGHGVAVAATAEEALHKIEQGRPDVILLDLRMPVINSVGLLYRLREDPANDDIMSRSLPERPASMRRRSMTSACSTRKSGKSRSPSKTFSRSLGHS